MIEVQVMKTVGMLRPQLKDDGDFGNNAAVDTQGWAHLRVLIYAGDTDVASGDAIGSTAEGNALKLEECDTEGGSYSDITDAALSDPIQHDEDDKLFAIDVDLRGTHKRYMRVNAPHSAAGAVNGSNLCIVGILSRPQRGPHSAAGQGLEELVTA